MVRKTRKSVGRNECIQGRVELPDDENLLINGGNVTDLLLRFVCFLMYFKVNCSMFVLMFFACKLNVRMRPTLYQLILLINKTLYELIFKFTILLF